MQAHGRVGGAGVAGGLSFTSAPHSFLLADMCDPLPGPQEVGFDEDSEGGVDAEGVSLDRALRKLATRAARAAAQAAAAAAAASTAASPAAQDGGASEEEGQEQRGVGTLVSGIRRRLQKDGSKGSSSSRSRCAPCALPLLPV